MLMSRSPRGGIFVEEKTSAKRSCSRSGDALSLSRDRRSPRKTCSIITNSFPNQAGGMEQVGSAYAAALVETAQAKGSLDAVHADVDTLQVRIFFYRNGEIFAACHYSKGVADRRPGKRRRAVFFLVCLSITSSPGTLGVAEIQRMHPREKKRTIKSTEEQAAG